MFLFDTHCHIFYPNYNDEEIKKIFRDIGKMKRLNYFLNVGYDFDSNKKIINQLKEYKFLFGALGIHPNSDDDLNEKNLKFIEENISIEKKIIAIGEIGLDYYRNYTKKDKQKKWFEKQLNLAKNHNLPALLHIRDAFLDSFDIIKKSEIKKAILHCFTGSWNIAKEFIDFGDNFYISFSGNITYKNKIWKKNIEEVIKNIPLNRILLETDSPYLSPEPFRGKKNYPENLIFNLKKISEIKGIDEKRLSYIIFENTLNIFDIKGNIIFN